MDAFSPLTETDLLELLTEQAVPFERIEHPAVFTVEQADLYTADAPGAGTKNLFLCDDKKKTYLLVTVPSHKRVDIRQLGNHLGLKKLHFASAEGLYELLGLTPGAVTIMGLVNDQQQRVKFYLDEELANADALQCHPLVNTATLIIAMSDLRRFLEAIQHPAEFIQIPALED